MEKVASHINEMQKIYEDYGAVFDQLVAEQIGHDGEVKRGWGGCSVAPPAGATSKRSARAPVSNHPRGGTCLADVVFSAWPLGAEHIYRVMQYLAERTFKVDAKPPRGVKSAFAGPLLRPLGLCSAPPLSPTVSCLSPKVTEISMGEFLAHSTAVWLNPHPSLGRVRKDPEMTVFGERARQHDFISKRGL